MEFKSNIELIFSIDVKARADAQKELEEALRKIGNITYTSISSISELK